MAKVRDVIMQRYGSLSRGFRLALSPGGSGRHLDFNEFSAALLVLKFNDTDVQLIWTEVGLADKDKLELHHFSPDSVKSLRSLRNILVTKFESVEQAWSVTGPSERLSI